MKFNLITKITKIPGMNIVTRKASSVGLKLVTKAPELSLAGGIIAGGACIVLACRETIKAQEVIDKHKADMDKIHEAAKLDMMYSEAKITDECSKGRDTLITYSSTAVKLMKTYAPAMICGAISIAAILYSHGMLKKRYLGVVAAYNAVSDRFAKYREAVVKEMGEEVDSRLIRGLSKEEVVETKTDENGNEVSSVTNKRLCDYSTYARFFDESNPEWSKNPGMNFDTLHARQMHANDRLKAKGYLFLNEVYEMLNLPATDEGSVVGWVMKGDGDGYVDFGIFDKDSSRARAFVNREERNILLDFNVDGIIIDKITRNVRIARGEEVA